VEHGHNQWTIVSPALEENKMVFAASDKQVPAGRNKRSSFGIVPAYRAKAIL
jgi:hypothetical protein